MARSGTAELRCSPGHHCSWLWYGTSRQPAFGGGVASERHPVRCCASVRQTLSRQRRLQRCRCNGLCSRLGAQQPASWHNQHMCSPDQLPVRCNFRSSW